MTNLARKTVNPNNALANNVVSAVSASQLKISFADIIANTEVGIQGSALTFSFPESFQTTWGAVQGVARNSSNWFGINTISLDKRNLDGSLVLSNGTPFAGLPAGLNHCGDSHVDEQYLYVPISQYISSTQTSPVTVIAWYNVSDLSLAGFYDISYIDERMNGSGLCLSPDGEEFWVSSFRSEDIQEDYNQKIWRFRKSDGLHLGEHTLSQRVLEIQGITWNPDTKALHVNSWRLAGVGRRPRVFIFDDAFQLQQITRPTGIGSDTSSNEIQGTHYYDGKMYFNMLNSGPRVLYENTAIVKAESRENSPQFLSGNFGDSGTVLIRCRLPTRPPSTNTIFDNLDDPDHWESWHSNNRQLNWRVNSGQPGCAIPSVTESEDERLLSFSWERDGTNVNIQLGLNGVWESAATQTWIAPPSQGLYLGARNTGNSQADAQFRDVIVFDKELSSAELAAVYADFDDLYLMDGQPALPPQGVVTIDSVSKQNQSVTVSFTYNDTDETGFEYRLNEGTPVSVESNPFTLNLDVGNYSLQVRAVNGAGASDWSTAAAFEITANAIPLTVTDIPDGTYSVDLLPVGGGIEDWFRLSDVAFVGGEANIDTELNNGTELVGVVYTDTDLPTTGAGIYAVVTDGS